MLDAVLLRLMKHRREFFRLYSVIPKDNKVVDPQTMAIVADFKKYFETFPSHDTVDKDTFVPRFHQWHPGLKDEQRSFYNKILDNVFDKEVDDDQRENIVGWLSDVELATAAANLAENYANGDVNDLFSDMISIMDMYRKRRDVKYDKWIDDNIRDLMQEEFQDGGVEWRLHCLRESMRKLRGGDFGIIAGRPDKGKTSFIASEATYMAPQLPDDKNVLWLNNEGPGRRIVPRLYQAAIDCTSRELGLMAQSDEAERRYIEIVGRRDRIRVIDIHGKTNGQVELIIEDNNPGLIIYDMIDNIGGFGDAARTDLALEKMYQWARERSVKYDAIGLATSQISADGDEMAFPGLGMLKDSKTGKQGACDFQLMIGAQSDRRYISLPKNKLRRPDGPGDPRTEVVFDGVRGRYRDITPASRIVEGSGTDANSGQSSDGNSTGEDTIIQSGVVKQNDTDELDRLLSGVS